MSRSRKPLEPSSPRCKRTLKSGEQCKNLAIRGAVVCRMHGGSAPQIRNKAAQRVEEHVANAKIARFLAQNQIEPVDNPLEALRELAGEIVAVKGWLRDQVTHLDHESSVQGEQIAAVMQLYSNFLDKSERVLVNIAKLNIDERLSHIQHAQAQIMVQVFAEALRKVLPEQQKQADAKVIIGQLLAKYDQ
jgi:hypothetical protein